MHTLSLHYLTKKKKNTKKPPKNKLEYFPVTEQRGGIDSRRIRKKTILGERNIPFQTGAQQWQCFWLSREC